MLPDLDPGQNFETQSVDGILSIEKSAELDALQEVAAEDTLNFLDVRTPEDQFPLIAMATGIGKGRIIHKIIEKRVRRNPSAKILVIAGTKLTLVDQTQSALQGYLEESDGIEHDWVNSEFDDELNEITEDVSEENIERSFLYSTVDYKQRKESEANVHVGTIQTIQSDSGKGNLNPEDYDLVIVDEAHNIGTQKRLEVIKKFKNVVGFTATPYRHTGVLKVPEQYGFTIINSLTLPEAQEREFLPPLIETPITTEHLIDEIPTNLNGEIDYKKLEKLLKDSPNLRPFIADKIQEYIVDGEDNKKTIIAVNFVWEAEEIAKLLKEKGISVGVAVNQQAARLIHSEEIPALDAIERYKLPKENANSLQVLISPYVASEGFDAPLTEVLVWASPTDSSVRYTQFTGRLARRAPGKQYGHVIDFLYQTAQYKWSYNFGQWMKDTVVQLPNGRLFQGSKKQLQRVTSMQGTGNPLLLPNVDIGLEDLQATSNLLPIQETDFVLGRNHMSRLFIGGGTPRVRKIADEVLASIQSINPELFVNRTSGYQVVAAITDKALVISEMVKRGVELQRDIPPLADTEIAISQPSLTASYQGHYKKLEEVANLVLQQLEEENPDLIVERRSGKTTIVKAVRDREIFDQLMQKHGIELKQQLQASEEGEFDMTQANLQANFEGGWKKIGPAANDVMEEMRSKSPHLVVQRTSGVQPVNAITDIQLLIQLMEKRGIRSRIGLVHIQEGEKRLSHKLLMGVFVGGASGLSKLVEEIRKENPEHVNLITRRLQDGVNIVNVITDMEFLKSKMKEKGVKVRE